MNNAASFKANQFASNAEDYLSKGDFQNACTSHFRAAEQFLLAMNDTKDPEALKTLKLLYASHTRSGKELKKRLEAPSAKQSRNEILPDLNPERKTAVHLYSQQPLVPTNQGLSESMLAGSGLFVGQTIYNEDLVVTTKPSRLSDASGIAVSNKGPAKIIPNDSPSNSSIAQSYLILDRDAKEILSPEEEQDPFNKFWDAVESLVQKISGPMAFTSAPISENDMKARIQLEKDKRLMDNGSFLNSYMVVDSDAVDCERSVNPLRRNSEKVRNIDYSADKNTSQKYTSGLLRTVEEYEIENAHLKQTVDLLTKRIVELERTYQENNMLRSSIIQFKQDIQKQRALNPKLFASIPPSNAPLIQRNKLSMSVAPIQPAETVKLQQQIEKLQRELANANETIAAQQRKWDKLKENVKKKRESKGSVSEILIEGAPGISDNPGLSSQSPSHSGHSSLYYSINQSRFS